jgi:hypothetical protein
MKATLMLADYAVVAENKLTIVGGGWTVTGPAPQPFAIAIKLEIPWHTALDQHTIRLELLDADGQPVLGPTLQGVQPIVVEGELTPEPDSIPADVKPGTPIDLSFAFNFQPMPLAPGQRYEWRLTIDGKAHEDWSLAFNTRRAEAQAA